MGRPEELHRDRLPVATNRSPADEYWVNGEPDFVEENTYLRVALIASAYGPVAAGMTSAKYS
jgi:hypothetical protein